MGEADLKIYLTEDLPEKNLSVELHALRDAGLDVHVRVRERSIYGTNEWTIPSAIVIYLTRSFCLQYLVDPKIEAYSVIVSAIKKIGLKILSFFKEIQAENVSIKPSGSFSIFIEIDKKREKYLKFVFYKGLDEETNSKIFDELFVYFKSTKFEGLVNSIEIIYSRYNFDIDKWETFDPYNGDLKSPL